MYAPNFQLPSNDQNMGSLCGYEQYADEEYDQIQNPRGIYYLALYPIRAENKKTTSTTNENRNNSTLLGSKDPLGAQNTAEKSTFSDHSELNVSIGQTACSGQTVRCHAISSETGSTSESSSSDISTTNSEGSRPFHCLEYGTSFTKQTYFNQHQQIHHEQPQDQYHATRHSRLDSRNFKSSDITRKPVSLEHKGIITENRSSLISLQVEPSNCVRGIEKKENFKMKRFECSVCQKSFKSKCSLKMHMRSHTGEKPYECEMCNKSFSQICNLTRHVRTHTGNKPYKCEKCNKTFANMSNLTDHIRTHTGKKPYNCEVCNKTFSSKAGLHYHKHRHTEMHFKCDVCNKTFLYKSSLRRHIRVHAKRLE